MYVTIGLFTILGALMGALLPVAVLQLQRSRVYITLNREGDTVPTSEEIEEIHELHAVEDRFADGDVIRSDGTHEFNWFHRTLVFIEMVKLPAIIGVVVGFIIDNMLNLIF